VRGFTIAIEDQGTLRKITKIVPYKQGGFAVLAPYHNARQGFLAKHPVDYSQPTFKIRLEDMVAYSAEDRVKLSTPGWVRPVLGGERQQDRLRAGP